MSENGPEKFIGSRARTAQRRGWMLLLLAALAFVLVTRYLESRRARTAAPTVAQPSLPVPKPPIQPPTQPAPKPAPAPSAIPQPKPAPTPAKPPVNASQAATPLAYRQDAARHIYAKNAARIYQGKLQPLLYAIGVLQVSIDGQGRVQRLHWLRAPRQAPEVIREIERTVRAVAPYPVPARMGRVVYTDTWLWDKSGKFQLDTLTEGQH